MDSTIHIAVTRRVRPEFAQEFERRLAMFASHTLTVPGSRGVHLLYPAAGSGSTEYGILRSFGSAADRDAFYQSPLYKKWSEEVEPMIEGKPAMRELDGLEAWFRAPNAGLPPRWKMAVLTWIAVWPVSMGVPAVLAPFYAPSVPVTIRAGIGAAGIVLVLTWAAMPLLVKVAKPWLHSKTPRPVTPQL